MTVACAFVDRHVDDLVDYLNKKRKLETLVPEPAASETNLSFVVSINCGDDENNGNVYPTGTVAKAGDDS